MATTKREKVNPCDTDFIDGPELVLKSEQVSAPVKVRYMGQPRTSGILYNVLLLKLSARRRLLRVHHALLG